VSGNYLVAKKPPLSLGKYQKSFFINGYQYIIDVVYQSGKSLNNRICLLHSKESWKKCRQEIEIARTLQGKPLGRNQYYHRDRTQSGICGWITCDGCRRSVCSLCIHALCIHLPRKYGRMNFLLNEWCSIIQQFDELTVESSYMKTMTIPRQKSHCCGLKQQGKLLAVSPNKLLASRSANANATEERQLDGLLHYAPYKMVFHSSGRFYESLAVAQQGKAKSTCYQAPVFHSVIPHQDALNYKIAKNYPSGFLDDITDSDDTWTVWVECPMDLKNKYSLRVRRLRIHRDQLYDDVPVRGISPLSNPLYFQQCVLAFDEEWEDSDIGKGIDVCLVTGIPGQKDVGKNEILLAGRIYCDFLRIPKYNETQLNEFFSMCIDELPKNGYEVSL
jgi:hypothetical protein